MFSQNPTARMPPVLQNQRMHQPVYPNYGQQQGPPQHQGHVQHHQQMQPDHGASGNGNNMLTHHGNFQPGGMPNSSPFANASVLQNGAHGAQQRGPNQASLSPHWQEQLRVFKECQDAHVSMQTSSPHFWARARARENDPVPTPAAPKTADGEDGDDRRKPWSVDSPLNRQDWHNMDLSGQGFFHISPQLCAYNFIQELFINSNKIRSIPPAIGQLRQLRHLDASYNNIESLPVELGMCTYLKNLLLFNNRLRDVPSELGTLHLLEMLGIEGNPEFDYQLKADLMEHGTKFVVSSLREKIIPPPPPEPRQMIVLQEAVSSSLESVKVMSWNVLADRYATPQTYGYTPPDALHWSYRKRVILEEMAVADADFLCLQEVTTDAFKRSFRPELIKRSYDGILEIKSRARTMAYKEASTNVDGCAIFYKSKKWTLLAKQLVEFAPIAINRPDMNTGSDVFNRVMPRDNIALVALFESFQTGARVVVINAHLTWDHALADVKLVQTGILMERAADLAADYAKTAPLDIQDKKRLLSQGVSIHPEDVSEEDVAAEPAQSPDPPAEPAEPAPSQSYRNAMDIPVVVCGDFNSTFGSSVYNLMAKGMVPPDHSDLEGRLYGEYTRNGIKHPFKLRDAYSHIRGTTQELPFTNYTPGFTDVIDYIWYSRDTLDIVSILGPLDPEYLKRIPSFPYYHFPADHIHILAEFVIKARKDKKTIVQPDFGPSSSSNHHGVRRG